MPASCDQLDLGDPKNKLWAEFRMSFASARLQLAVLEDFGDKVADYLKELDSRWNSAFLHARLLAEEDPEYDGDWVLLDRDEKNATFIQADLAIEVSEQLFPDGHVSSDLLQNTLGLVTIGFHSALEAFAVGHEVTSGRGSLPEAISRWLLRRAQPDLEAWVSDQLVACDATRHIVVHRRGIVDEAYAHRVKNNNYHVGERRPLDASVVKKFAVAVWRTAVRIRDAV